MQIGSSSISQFEVKLNLLTKLPYRRYVGLSMNELDSFGYLATADQHIALGFRATHWFVHNGLPIPTPTSPNNWFPDELSYTEMESDDDRMILWL